MGLQHPSYKHNTGVPSAGFPSSRSGLTAPVLLLLPPTSPEGRAGAALMPLEQRELREQIPFLVPVSPAWGASSISWYCSVTWGSLVPHPAPQPCLPSGRPACVRA
ncbi:hypothetical protein KIL84_014314 [Mauremys mutica]|uniref:Uncharacterized protein n=1 Tax=Mauremys mutica TaxID=74926 RepID=A0A9D3XQT8_9SAUR|nr:hypothetical protein KIL84_014314 [Mauremys mutica]